MKDPTDKQQQQDLDSWTGSTGTAGWLLLLGQLDGWFYCWFLLLFQFLDWFLNWEVTPV